MPRATPKSVEERRREIIAAAWPLIAEQGVGVSTKRIADAVGVAEGTLFRVFPTKASLIHAAMTHALDPTQMVVELDAIARTAPLTDRIAQVLGVVRHSTEKTRALVLAIREQSLAPAGAGPTASSGAGSPFVPPFGFGRPPAGSHPGHNPVAFQEMVATFRRSVERVLAPDQDRLGVDLPTAASFILIFCTSYLMPPLSPLSLEPDLAANLIARALLDPGKEQPA